MNLAEDVYHIIVEEMYKTMSKYMRKQTVEKQCQWMYRVYPYNAEAISWYREKWGEERDIPDYPM